MSSNITYQEIINKVSFQTTVGIDDNGIVHVTTFTKNDNPFRKYQVRTGVIVYNNLTQVCNLQSNPVTLYGSLSSSLVPGRKSTNTQRLYDKVDLSQVEIGDNLSVNRQMKDSDSKISDLATQIRRLRVLEGDDSDKVKSLIQEMTNLKNERAKQWDQILYKRKLDALSVHVSHSAEKQS